MYSKIECKEKANYYVELIAELISFSKVPANFEPSKLKLRELKDMLANDCKTLTDMDNNGDLSVEGKTLSVALDKARRALQCVRWDSDPLNNRDRESQLRLAITELNLM